MALFCIWLDFLHDFFGDFFSEVSELWVVRCCFFVVQSPLRSGVSASQLTQGLVPGHGDMVLPGQKMRYQEHNEGKTRKSSGRSVFLWFHDILTSYMFNVFFDVFRGFFLSFCNWKPSQISVQVLPHQRPMEEEEQFVRHPIDLISQKSMFGVDDHVTVQRIPMVFLRALVSLRKLMKSWSQGSRLLVSSLESWLAALRVQDGDESEESEDEDDDEDMLKEERHRVMLKTKVNIVSDKKLIAKILTKEKKWFEIFTNYKYQKSLKTTPSTSSSKWQSQEDDEPMLPSALPDGPQHETPRSSGAKSSDKIFLRKIDKNYVFFQKSLQELCYKSHQLQVHLRCRPGALSEGFRIRQKWSETWRESLESILFVLFFFFLCLLFLCKSLKINISDMILDSSLILKKETFLEIYNVCSCSRKKALKNGFWIFLTKSLRPERPPPAANLPPLPPGPPPLASLPPMPPGAAWDFSEKIGGSNEMPWDFARIHWNLHKTSPILFELRRWNAVSNRISSKFCWFQKRQRIARDGKEHHALHFDLRTLHHSSARTTTWMWRPMWSVRLIFLFCLHLESLSKNLKILGLLTI